MSLAAPIVAVALDATAVALLGWTTWIAFRARERPSGRSFTALSGMLMTWGLCEVASELPELSALESISSLASIGAFIVALFIPAALAVYALSYTGRGTGFTWLRVLVAVGIVLPLGLAAAVFIGDPTTTTAERTLASLLGTELVLMFGLFVYATYLLVGHGRSNDRLSGTQMPVVLSGVAAPYLGGLVGNGAGAVDGVTIGLLASGGLLAVALRRYPVSTGFPKAEHVARTRVVEALQEAVVVIDWDAHVLDANERTGDLFGSAPTDLVGEPIGSVVDGLESVDLDPGATGTVTLRTTVGRREFEYSVSAVDGASDDDGATPTARAVLLRDVTDRQTREQRLTVLNRVLRHNVRNELDVVLAHADRIEDDGPRTAITDRATALVDIGEKARSAEAIMTASTESPERVDVTEIAATVVEEHRREHPEADVSLSCPSELTMSSHPVILRQLLVELVENAIVHNHAASPSVEVGAATTPDGTAELVVADDGPGIPDREADVISNGPETQLEHGRGMGLWLVNWATAQLGGELTFDRDEPEGTVVTVRLHDVEYEP
ncbi:ATP-binding protein [Halorubellus salinus]|uniref:ATP-binding protein n=1 Tax=Halorubellus salinus TaxID=755309 RepID=UPI001D075662|nr:ATP-binding protein [Halorubellus salinus]